MNQSDNIIQNLDQANILYKQNRFLEARDVIEKAFDKFEESDCIRYSSYFQLAAQIYANIEDLFFAKKYYEKFYYYSYKSDKNIFCKGWLSLYSFRRFNEYTLKDLIKNEITVVHPSQMNDPFDSLATFFAKSEYLDKRCKDNKNIGIQIEMSKHFRIRAFSTGECNSYMPNDSVLREILMWSHYADSHKGLCIRYELSPKFNYNFLEKTDEFYNFKFIQDVKYTDEPINFKDLRLNTQNSFTQKNKCWKYENEVRLITFDSSTDEPYVGIPLDEESCIKEIIFGYCCPKETIDTVKALMSNKIDVKFSKMQVGETNIYQLVKVDL